MMYYGIYCSYCNEFAQGTSGVYVYYPSRQIEEAKRRIATLKFTVKTFLHLKETGAPFPDEGTSQREQEAR